MLLNAAIIELESGFNVKTGIWSAIAQTGEPYVAITSGGEKAEGQEMALFETQAVAVERWLIEAKRYAAGKSGTLYWRTMPEMGSTRGWFAVYSRLLISAAPGVRRIVGDDIVLIGAEAA